MASCTLLPGCLWNAADGGMLHTYANSCRRPLEKVVSAAFAIFVRRVYRQIDANGGNEEDLQDSLNENIRSFTWVLIGLDD
jgi:hypothetical protein